MLCSGGIGLSTLRQILTDINLLAVCTDSKSSEIEKFCLQCGVPVFIGNPRLGTAREFLCELEIDVILSVNYLYVVEKDILTLPKLLSLNIHGSLLPKYRGRTPHIWAIINNERETGVTVHEMVPECDAGRIAYQTSLNIPYDSTGQDILNAFAIIYPEAIRNVLSHLEKNVIELSPQDDTKATFFGKRSPGDGEINWEWQRERIYNWVRALACPYPGAFTYHHGAKIIIDRVSLSDAGFDSITPNGTILATDPRVVVKTPNGAIVLDRIRENIVCKRGDRLSGAL